MRTAPLLLVVLTACGPSPATTSVTGESSGTSEVGSTTGAPVPTTGADATTSGVTTVVTGATTGGPGTSGAATTGVLDTGEATAGDTGSSTGEPLCGEPDADEVAATWTLTVDGKPPPESVSGPCVVTFSEPAGPLWQLALDCTIDGELSVVQLTITRTPEGGATLQVGDERVLDYRQEQIFWTNEWFALHIADNPFLTAVGGIKGDKVAPPGVTAKEFFGVDMAVVDGVCEPIEGPCGPTIRLGLAMTWSSGHRTIFDGQRGSLVDLGGQVQVWVGTATRPDDGVQCEDVPPAWFEVVTAGNFGP